MTYRVLIYIFEVGMKTFFFSQMRNFEVEIPIWNFFLKKRSFFWGWRLNFFWAHVITQHLQQIHWFKIFCMMYGLTVMLTITTSKVPCLLLLRSFISLLAMVSTESWKRTWANTHAQDCILLFLPPIHNSYLRLHYFHGNYPYDHPAPK